MSGLRERKRGNRLGFLFFETVLRTGGLRPAYAFLYLICLHYLLFDPTAVRAALAYVQRRFPRAGRMHRCWLAYLLFVSQGRCLIDRYCHTYGGLAFDIQLDGFEKLDALLADRTQGFVLLTAHVGNWQIAMTALQRMKRPVHLLMRPEDNAAVRDSLRIGQGGESVGVISVDSPMGGMVEAMNALERGDIVSIMGDRHYGHRASTVEFLGQPAAFPCAPFAIAAAACCPVVVMLSAKTGARTYAVEVCDVFTPQPQRAAGRGREHQHNVQRYATRLEGWLTRNPLQCFLFLDIWSDAL